MKNTFNSDETVATMEYLAKLAKYAPPGNLNYGYAEILQNFVQGKTATCYYAGRVMQRIHRDNPSLEGKFSAFQVPAYDGGAYQPSYGSGAVCCILNKAPNPKAAKVWVTDYQFRAPYYLNALLGAPGNDYPVVNLDATEQARYDADPILKLNADTVAKVMVPAAGMSASPAKETPDHRINPHGGDIIAGPVIPTTLQAVITGTSAKDAVAGASAQIDDILAQ